jgi:hypothetical protein
MIHSFIHYRGFEPYILTLDKSSAWFLGSWLFYWTDLLPLHNRLDLSESQLPYLYKSGTKTTLVILWWAEWDRAGERKKQHTHITMNCRYRKQNPGVSVWLGSIVCWKKCLYRELGSLLSEEHPIKGLTCYRCKRQSLVLFTKYFYNHPNHSGQYRSYWMGPWGQKAWCRIWFLPL